jgi:hypothetical protein
VVTGGTRVHLSTIFTGETNANNLNFEWFTVTNDFTKTPITVNGNYINSNTLGHNLTIAVYTNTIFAVFVTDNGLSQHPVAYNYTNVAVIGNVPPYYVPISITNNQASATNQIFQQLINVDSSAYNGITSSWNNIEFTTGPSDTGNVLQAWVQNNTTNSATDTPVWIKLTNPIPGNGGSTTIYMNILANSIMSANGPTGEAPYLSPMYAEYDNGANVFNFYSNFSASNTLSNSIWTINTLINYTVNTISNVAIYSVNNGITLSVNGLIANNTEGEVDLDFANSVSTNNVAIESISYTNQGGLEQGSAKGSSGGYGPLIYFAVAPKAYYYYDHINNTGYGQGTFLHCNINASLPCINYFAIFDPLGLPVLKNNTCKTGCLTSPYGTNLTVVDSDMLFNSNEVWSLSSLNGNYLFTSNSIPFNSPQSQNASTKLGWNVSLTPSGYSSYATIHIYLVRTRILPPNNIMPTATFT